MKWLQSARVFYQGCPRLYPEWMRNGSPSLWTDHSLDFVQLQKCHLVLQLWSQMSREENTTQSEEDSRCICVVNEALIGRRGFSKLLKWNFHFFGFETQRRHHHKPSGHTKKTYILQNYSFKNKKDLSWEF